MYFGGIPLVSAINYKGMEWYSGIADTPQISSIKTYLSCEKPRPHARNDSVANYKRKDQMTVAKTHKCYSGLGKYIAFCTSM